MGQGRAAVTGARGELAGRPASTLAGRLGCTSTLAGMHGAQGCCTGRAGCPCRLTGGLKEGTAIHTRGGCQNQHAPFACHYMLQLNNICAALLELLEALTAQKAALGAAAFSVTPVGQQWCPAAAAAHLRQRAAMAAAPGGCVLQRRDLLAVYRETCLPASVPLAAGLELNLRERHQEVGAQLELELELARVAATRSCAFLGCANLRASGGPDAGQGVGSLKCAACRAVWYCGTACSHADWRAGHKRVCKALAAERAGQRTTQQTN